MKCISDVLRSGTIRRLLRDCQSVEIVSLKSTYITAAPIHHWAVEARRRFRCHHGKFIARVYPVHMISAEQCQVAANHRPSRPTWVRNPPVGCYRLHPALTLTLPDLDCVHVDTLDHTLTPFLSVEGRSSPKLRIRDESILGIPMGPMAVGIVKLVSWEWEWLDGNGRE